MFLLDEMVSKPHLFSSFLIGLEAILTIFMLIYISGKEIFYTTKDNIDVNVMLAASKVQ